jgi:site-specific DNA recombinase
MSARENRGGQAVDRKVIRDMLRNPKNAGLRGLRGQVMGRGDWPAIVPEDTWRAAVTMLNEPARRANLRGIARRWVGSGLYLCGRCGSDMRVSSSGERGHGRHGYRCRESAHLTRTTGDQIDNAVQGVIAERLRRADAVDLLPDTNAAAVTALRTELSALSVREDQLGEAFTDGTMTPRQIAVANERLAARRTVVTAELAVLTSETALGTVLAAADPGHKFLTSPVTMKQKIIDALAVVTLLPTKGGKRGFDPESVRFDWKTGE